VGFRQNIFTLFLCLGQVGTLEEISVTNKNVWSVSRAHIVPIRTGLCSLSPWEGAVSA